MMSAVGILEAAQGVPLPCDAAVEGVPCFADGEAEAAPCLGANFSLKDRPFIDSL